MGILGKYSLWMLAILLFAASCITGAALWHQQASLTNEAILRGESIARNLANSAADALLTHDDLLLISQASSATRENPGVRYAALVDGKGLVVGHADASAIGKALKLGFLREHPWEGGRGTRVNEALTDEEPVWDVSVPIVLDAGERVLGTAHVGLARATVMKTVRESMLVLSAISLLVMAFGVGLTLASLRVVVRPLRELSGASEAVGKGDLSVHVPVRSHDEVGRLAGNFNAMVLGLKDAEAAKGEKSRIASELALAHSIQADLLLSQPPLVEGLDVAFMCIPAKELGGDFYDCIEVCQGALWGFLIADVSGKGVPAALHMANLHNLFRIFGRDDPSPLSTLRKVNAVAFNDLKAEAFVTLIYAVVDPKSRLVRMVNAGHDPAYCVRKSGIEAFESTAPPVGLAEATEFDQLAKEISFTLGQGDMLFTYTDGVTEAMDPRSDQFSLTRLQAVLGERKAAGVTLSKMYEALREHASGAEQSDDITMLAVKAG